MQPNIAAAPAPKNLVHDIMPPTNVQPMLADVPVAKQAPQAAPAEHPITGQPSQNHMQPAVAQSNTVPAKAPLQKTAQPAQRTAHQPKNNTPIIAISVAILFAVVMIAAAFMAYRKG